MARIKNRKGREKKKETQCTEWEKRLGVATGMKLEAPAERMHRLQEVQREKRGSNTRPFGDRKRQYNRNSN